MTQRIVIYTEPNQAQHTHYFLRGCGRLRPLTDEEAKQLRRNGVAIELPVTAPLQEDEDAPQ